MVVNIEWPGFQSDVLPLLEEDRQLDAESDRPGDQGFEKLTAGLYLGDIARRILHRYIASDSTNYVCVGVGRWEVWACSSSAACNLPGCGRDT